MATKLPRQPAVVPASLREVFRYQKAGRTRVYSLRPLDDESAELWVVSWQGGRQLNAHRMVTFTASDDERPFLDDCERQLRNGGWSRI